MISRSRLWLYAAAAVWIMAAVVALPRSRLVQAGDTTVIAKTYDLTQLDGWQIPATGDTVATGPTSTATKGAITLAATAGLATACVYSPIIDITNAQAPAFTATGPTKGAAGMEILASTASGTVTLTAVALYGVSQSNITTPSDQSSTSATGTMTFTGTGQTDTTTIKMYSNHVPRNARFMRLLLKNTSGVAAVIPNHGWQYATF